MGDYEQDEPNDGDDVIMAYGDVKKLKANLAALREENERLKESHLCRKCDSYCPANPSEIVRLKGENDSLKSELKRYATMFPGTV